MTRYRPEGLLFLPVVAASSVLLGGWLVWLSPWWLFAAVPIWLVALGCLLWADGEGRHHG